MNGAPLTLRLAVERPDLVHRLTLIEPVYFAAAKGTPVHAGHVRMFRPFVAAMLQGDERRAAEVFHDIWGYNGWDDLSARRQTYLSDRIHLIVAAAAAIEEDTDGITSALRLGALDIPVTLIRGERSPPIVAAIHHVLTARIPGASDHVVQDAAHMVPMTHAAQVATIMRAADPETA